MYTCLSSNNKQTPGVTLGRHFYPCSLKSLYYFYKILNLRQYQLIESFKLFLVTQI